MHDADGSLDGFAARQEAGLAALLTLAELGSSPGGHGQEEGPDRARFLVERIVWDPALPSGLLAAVPEGGPIHVSALIPARLRREAIGLARRAASRHAK